LPSQAIELRTPSGARTFVQRAEGVLYDPALELLWIRNDAQLSVIDLRKSSAVPELVARDVPSVNRLQVNRADSSVEREDGCDLPSLSLEWEATPHIEGELVDATSARIVNGAWLSAELHRRSTPAGVRRTFSDSRAPVPQELMDCQDPEQCGATVPFGALGWQLVLVQEQMGGDCYQRACLLFDPASGLFASTLKPHEWRSARDTPRGPCGPFRFDESQTKYLVEDRLCLPGRGCQKLGGTALGWLTSGDTVGEPGLGRF
jgi:hypothetical protein